VSACNIAGTLGILGERKIEVLDALKDVRLLLHNDFTLNHIFNSKVDRKW
jgi:hypothetical protein